MSKPEQIYTELLQTRVQGSLYKRVEKLAKAQQRPLSQMLRIVITRGVIEEENLRPVTIGKKSHA